MSLLLFTFRFVKIKNVLKLSLKKKKILRTCQPQYDDIFKNIQPGLEKPGSYKMKWTDGWTDGPTDGHTLL